MFLHSHFMFWPDESLVPPESRVLVAVSSGADSVALLHWLVQLRRDVVVGHINHALHELRYGDCDHDEQFVSELCSRLNVPLCVQTLELPRKNGHVNEVVAREGRYQALLQIALQEKCDLVATAHSATDALETTLLNLGRGGGPQGWLGIAPSRLLGAGVQLIRPLWRVGRDEIRYWLAEQNIGWREDESNRSELFRRNRVRHEVLPQLSDIFARPSDELAKQFAQNAALRRDESEFLEQEAQRALESLVTRRHEGLLVLDGVKFCEYHPALQRRVLRLGVREIAPEVREIERDKVETARKAVLEGQRRTVWMWRSAVRVEWTGAGSGNRLRFARV